MDFKDPCNFVWVEPELSPGAIEEWLSIVKDGKKLEKGKRRSDFSTKVKKHLSALGWVFSYAQKGKKLELRYKSPNGKWFYSLATACMSCCSTVVDEQQQQQIVPKDNLSCSIRNLSSGSSNFVPNVVDSVKIVPSFDVSEKKRKRVKECDVTVAFNGSTPNEEEKNRSPDLITIVAPFDESNQQQKNRKTRKRVEDCVLNGETPNEHEKNRSSDSVKMFPDFDISNKNSKKKRKRVKDFDDTAAFNGKNPNELQEKNRSSDLIKIGNDFDVSKQKQKKKWKRVKDFDINGETPKEEEKIRSSNLIRILLNLNVLNQQQKKRSKTAASEDNKRIGKSLRKILEVMDKKKMKKKGEKESLRFCRKDCGPEMNCDVCCVCHCVGELLLCDGCPSAFHHTCLGLSTLPEEDLWFCPCCCCDICKSIESPSSENSMLMSCEQCQRRFHLKCLKEEGSSYAVSWRGWFCSSQCDSVYSALQNLLGCKISVGDDSDLVWTLMRAPNEYEHYDDDDERISKLDSAVEILHQGFEPTKDPFSGNDLVEELIFRRNRGFYTVILERKKVPVTIAAIRVGKDEAEIPLVATLSDYRRRGMCRLLMDELEKQMYGMRVFKLVLPAATDVVTTWTQRFGFSVMESWERLEVLKHGMLDFAGTVMCHKFLMLEMETQEEEEEEEEEDSADSSLTG